jgi:glucose-1-phosphate thymidylyltransferase
LKCLILAGGFATRLYPITINRAKALLEFRGKPVISHLVDRIPEDLWILVSTNKKFESDFINWRDTLGRPVEICIEEALADDQKLGAVSAIDFWIRNRNITEDLLVIAADNYFELDLPDLLSQFDGQTSMIAVYDVGDKEKACEIDRACQMGLVILDGDRVVRLDEKPPKATSSIIATGIYVLPSRIFPVLSQYCHQRRQDNMGSFIGHLLNQDEVRAYPFTQTWIDIGNEITAGRISI